MWNILKRLSIRIKVVGAATAAVVLVAVLVLIYRPMEERRHALVLLADEMHATARLVSSTIGSALKKDDQHVVDEMLNWLCSYGGYSFAIFKDSLGNRSGVMPSGIPLSRAQQGLTKSNNLWYIYVPVEHDGKVFGNLLLGVQLDSAVKKYLSPLAGEVIFMLLALSSALLLSWYLGTRITRPIQKLRQAAQEAARGNLNVSLEEYSGDELASLNRCFNRMLGNIRDGLAALRRSEQHHRELFEGIPIGLYRSTHDGQILDANPALIEMLGYPSKEEIQKVSAHDLYVDDKDRRRWENQSREAGILNNFEEQLKRYDGSLIWVREHTRAVLNSAGELQYYEGSIEDIEEQKAAEKQLIWQNEFLYNILESLPHPFYVIDTENNCIRIANSAARKQLTKPSEFCYHDIQPDQHPCTKDRDDCPLRRVRETQKPAIIEQRYMDDAGNEVIWEVHGYPIFDEQGNLIQMIEYNLDITERKKAAEQLTRERDLLQTLMDSIPDTIYVKDTRSRFLRINRAQANLLGLSSADEALRKSDSDFFDEEFARRTLQEEEQIIKSGKPLINKIEQIRRPDEQLYWVSTTKVPIFDASGQVNGIVGISRDITGLKKMEKNLRQAKKSAEAANNTKSEFLANMSHEIRTPMNGIIGMTELALETELTGEQREYLEMVNTSAASLLAIINDILDFSKIEAGKLELDPIDFCLRDSLDETIKLLGIRATQKGLNLAVHISPAVPDQLVGDPGRLRQVLVNLLGNAIKFTEEGEILLLVELENKNGDQSVILRFSVTDTGVGIPPEKQQIVFDAFSQADGSTTRKYGGTGLGLSISSRLVKLMNGTIWVESPSQYAFAKLGHDQPGEQPGTTFHFTARFGLAGGLEAPVKTDWDQLEGKSTLIVDDNLTNRRILHEMLAQKGLAVKEVAGVRDALKVLVQFAAKGKPFELILVDCQLPGSDGFELSTQIKQMPAYKKADIIMLTSSGHRGDAARCKRLGLRAYLTKPISQRELYDAILTVSGEENKPQLVTRHTLRENRKSLKILLVEDNPINQMVSQKMLKKMGHHVEIAGTGRQAVQIWEEHLSASPFEIILMDVHMPEMDGLETTTLIRKMEEEKGGHVPIIALTAHALKEDSRRCLEAGMDGYLSKPIEYNKLHSEIEKLCGSAAEPDRKTVVSAEQALSAAVDEAEFMERLDHDIELAVELIEMFTADYPEMLASIQKAIETRNGPALELAAHTMKGTTANFSAHAARLLAAQLETAGRNLNFQAADLLYPRLKDEILRVVDELMNILNSFPETAERDR